MRARQPIAQAERSLPELARDYVMAQADVQRAAMRFDEVRGSLTERIRGLNETVQNAPELRDARRRIDEAYEAYEAAQQPVLQRVRGLAEYKQAMQERERVARELEQAKRSKQQDRIVALAKAKMQFGSTAHAMERVAVERDAQAQQAKRRLLEANQAMTEERQRLVQRAQEDPEFRESLEAVEQAQKALFEAQARLAASGAAYAQAQGMYDDDFYIRKYRGIYYGDFLRFRRGWW